MASEESNGRGFQWYFIVISSVFGVMVGILLSLFVWYFRRRWLRYKNTQPQKIEMHSSNKIQKNPVIVEADSTYQELDLTKMSKEDNYQSLIMKGNISSNDAKNDDDSTYTELSKMRDVEDNYQSLI